MIAILLYFFSVNKSSLRTCCSDPQKIQQKQWGGREDGGRMKIVCRNRKPLSQAIGAIGDPELAELRGESCFLQPTLFYLMITFKSLQVRDVMAKDNRGGGLIYFFSLRKNIFNCKEFLDPWRENICPASILAFIFLSHPLDITKKEFIHHVRLGPSADQNTV